MESLKLLLLHKDHRHRLRSMLVIIAGWLFFLLILNSSSMFDFFVANVDLPALFRARHAIGKDPSLDPRLKILSFDETTFATLKADDLYINEWATLLEAIDKRSPRAIVIDKLFSVLFDPLNEAPEALNKLKKLKTPVAVGAFVRPSRVQGRDPFPLSIDTSNLDRAYKKDDLVLKKFGTSKSNWFVYGPSKDFQSIFKRVGHINSGESIWVDAMIPLSDQSILPHLSLLSSKGTISIGDHLMIEQKNIPLDKKGRILANIAPSNVFFERHLRLAPILEAAKKGSSLEFIESGDVVVILPNMFTGWVDIKPTPLGSMPGGFVIASIVNSVITQNWLQLFGFKKIQIICAILLGAIIGATQGALVFWQTFGVIVGVYLAFTFAVFSFQGIVILWFFPLVGFIGTALSTFAVRSLSEEKRTKRISGELTDAAEIAKAFWPSRLPAWKAFEISAFHKPISEASGDWYAFLESKSGKFFHFVLCDITGHGVQAALIVSTCKTLLNTLRIDRPDYCEEKTFLERYAMFLDNLLYEQGKGFHVVSLLGLTFEPAERVVHCLTAGHAPPLSYSLRDPDSIKLQPLTAPHPPLGVHSSAEFKLKTFPFIRGDELLAYTDGVPIHRNLRTLRQILRERNVRWSDMPRFIFNKIWEAESAKKEGRTCNDDVSLVGFRYTASAMRQPKDSSDTYGDR